MNYTTLGSLGDAAIVLAARATDFMLSFTSPFSWEDGYILSLTAIRSEIRCRMQLEMISHARFICLLLDVSYWDGEIANSVPLDELRCTCGVERP